MPDPITIPPDDEFNRELVSRVHPADWQDPEPAEQLKDREVSVLDPVVFGKAVIGWRDHRAFIDEYLGKQLSGRF